MGIYSIVFDRDTKEFSERGGADARRALYECIEMGDVEGFDGVFARKRAEKNKSFSQPSFFLSIVARWG